MTNAPMNLCPRCGTRLHANADVCNACGSQINPSASGASPGPRGGDRFVGPPPQKKGLPVILIVVIAVAFMGASVVFIGILAAIALPNFIGAQHKAKVSSVKANMHTVQLAVESYATDFNGEYPASVDKAFKSYFPGGSNDGKRPAPLGPTNPFTGRAEWPTTVKPQPGTTVSQLRGDTSIKLQPGEIEYMQLENGKSYAILGGDDKGAAVHGRNPETSVLVLSNQ